MYYIGIITILLFSTMLPFGAIAEEVANIQYSEALLSDIVYDFDESNTYQVEGHSMKHLGFDHDVFVDVVPASNFRVGDIIAFECSHNECDGAYIKEITQKRGSCFWVEGRHDVWQENGGKRQSMDSRTTYGWLCDEDIDIYGAAFVQEA